MRKKNIFYIALVTALILLIPLVAMRFSSEVNWTLGDFIAAGILLFSAGFIYLLATSKLTKSKHRIIVGFAVTLALLYLWAELAVGIFTNWGS